MRAMLDTNVVLDHLFNRAPWAIDATAIWQANGANQFDAFVSAITPVNVFYVARKSAGAVLARRITASLLAAVDVCPVDQAVLHAAQMLAFDDFEDAVQHASASAHDIDAIVTRDASGFIGATLPILSPADLLSQLRTGRR